MSTLRADSCLHHADLLLGNLDGVELATAYVEGEPAELSYAITNALKEVGMVLHHVFGAEVSEPLFIAQYGKHHITCGSHALRFGSQYS